MWEYLGITLAVIGVSAAVWCFLSAVEDIERIRKVAERWSFGDLAQKHIEEHRRQMDEDKRRQDLIR